MSCSQVEFIHKELEIERGKRIALFLTHLNAIAVNAYDGYKTIP